MNKEEILRKSRVENKDEGMLQAENKGREIGYVAFVIVFCIVVFMNMFHGVNSYGPFAMFWAFCSVEAYPKYRFTKKKSYLYTMIFGTLAAILWLVNLWLSY